MPVTNSRKSDWVIWLAGLPVIWWAAILIADAIQPGRNLFELMEVLTEKLNHPFQLHYTEYTIKSVLVCTLLYAAGIGIFYSSQKNYRRGEEHGSARWGDARQICKKYSQKPYSQNILLTQNFRISLDTHEHRRCLNILVVGGSGAGKSRGFALPNIMQCCCSMVITDPKAELLRKTGGLLEKKGYEVRVFDLINPDTSFCYNPFEYVHDDKDVLRLISNLIQNTTPKGSQSSDPFWEKSETALLQALMLYLLHEAPPEEQNFAMIMEMLGSAQVKEEDEDYESPLDILFDRLEMRDPDSIAVKQYHIYKQAAGKTAKSILISVGVRLAAFNLPQIAKLTNTDELDLSSMGERKVALFCCIPDADTSLNYLVGMIYSQLFQTLYYMADRVHGGALPVPVNCIMDEFPNVSLPNEFEKILATCRSRSIYCSIIIQNMSQLKALFKDSWESLVGNCDEFLYLGGNEKETHKYVSELLGKETIDTNTYGQTKGKSGSYSTNFQQSGRELLQPDEVRMLDNQNALLFIRGERSILDAKYDLMKHPNIRYTEDGGAGPFNYAKAPLAHDDFTFDETRYNDYELLLDEDIIGELF
ncbi:MAG: VirD4-like conjugal transfer protein, CD1115 family [Dorea longicatena]